MTCSFSQTNYFWRAEAINGNWNDTNNWWNGTNAVTAGFGVLQFDNNNQLNMTNNFGGTFNTHQIVFQGTSNEVRTIGGNPIRLFDNGGTDPRIYNYSDVTHIFNVNIDGDNNNPLRIYLESSGVLTFNNPINNQGSDIQFRGASNATARFNGIISGGGDLLIRTSTIVALNAANTYTGNTEVDEGELWIEENGSIANGSNIFIGDATNGTTRAQLTKFFLADADGGQIFANDININRGNNTSRYIGSLNTSGVNEISGRIFIDNNNNNNIFDMNFQIVEPNAVLKLTGGIYRLGNNRVDFDLLKYGPGKLSVENNIINFNSSNNSSIDIREGELEFEAFPSFIRNRNFTITIGRDGPAALNMLQTSNNFQNPITVLSNGGTFIYNSSNNRDYSGVITLTGNLLFNNVGTRDLFSLNNITGAGNLTINSTGSGALTLEDNVYSFTGTTFIQTGTLKFNPPNGGGAVLTYNSKIDLNGGVLSTDGIGNNNRTIVSSKTLKVTTDSTIALGTANAHSLTFANSSGETWSGILTINGWSGTAGAAGGGTLGKIFFGNSNNTLTAAQLDKINFTGFGSGAFIKTNGEIVPKANYYSKGSLDPSLPSSWARNPNGTGGSPANFTETYAVYNVQNGHNMVTGSPWFINSFSKIIIQNGGTLESTSSVNVQSNGFFQVDNGGTYIHNNTSAFGGTIFTGTETFGVSSNFIIRNTNTTGFDASFNNAYGHVTINAPTLSGTVNFAGNLTTINGDFNILNTNNQEIRLSNSGGTLTVGGNFLLDAVGSTLVVKNTTNAGDQNFIVNGNFELREGTFQLNSNTTGGMALLRLLGNQITLGANATISGNAFNEVGFYIGGTGIVNVNINNPIATATLRNRFFYNAATVTAINESYSGTVAQNTVNGSANTPSSGYTVWPVSGSVINNFSINNPAGVTLMDNRVVNGNLTLTNGVLDLTTNTIDRNTSGGILTLGNAGGLKINGTATTPSNYVTHSIDAGSSVEYAGTNQVIASLNSSKIMGI
ncbi:beta strand repeat-containing protein [Flavobacterium sp.]|uniref:beta strand repeat-containing protein n=1 Tax=Flavobacterium sp. TaxID=239 RepID=UPI003F69ACA3